MSTADDHDIQATIGALVEEEHALRQALAAGEVSVEEENERLRHLERQLDQCWDLLRQRRAKREFAQDPDTAEARSETTVRDYRG